MVISCVWVPPLSSTPLAVAREIALLDSSLHILLRPVNTENGVVSLAAAGARTGLVSPTDRDRRGM